jgi:hypothetical protein
MPVGLDLRRTISSYKRIKISLIRRILNRRKNVLNGPWTARCGESLMLFDLWVLCLIATGLGMFLVSVIGDALSYLRQHLEQHFREQQARIDAPGAPMGWGH